MHVDFEFVVQRADEPDASVPVFDPLGTVTVTGPPMVGTSIRAPRTASFKVTGTST